MYLYRLYATIGNWHTDAAAGMRRTAVFERVNVGRDLREVNLVSFRALREHRWVVYALRAAHDLLAAHEHVVRVGKSLHCVIASSLEHSSEVASHIRMYSYVLCIR